MRRWIGSLMLAVMASSVPVLSQAANLPCLANASPPTFTENNIAPCSEDLIGNLRVTLGRLISGENQTLNLIYISDSGTPQRYTTTGDKNVKASPGEVVGVLAVSGTSVTVTFWNDADGTCSSNQVLGTLTLTNGRFEKIPARHDVGICMVVGGTSPDLTVYYK